VPSRKDWGLGKARVFTLSSIFTNAQSPLPNPQFLLFWKLLSKLLKMASVNHTSDYPNFHPATYQKSGGFDIFYPLRKFVDSIQVKNRGFAHLICQLIPCCCPFERNIQLFDHTLHIPALCKFNPLYDNFVALRFRALSYLSDECGEDVTKYIC
jgi:hypothetical protein